MLRAKLILIVGLIVAPALVVGTIVLLVDGSVADTSDWRDMLGFGVNGGLGLVIWVAGARVFRRSLRDDAPELSLVGLTARYQPILWLLGIGLGIFGGFGIIRSATETRNSLAEIYCGRVFEVTDSQHPTCMSVALACDDVIDEGPCGKIESSSQGEQCVAAYEAEVSQLTGPQRQLLPEVSGGDYGRAMLNVCLIKKSVI